MTVVSFLPCVKVRVVSFNSGTSPAAFLVAVFLAAVAVCLFEVKPAVAKPGPLFFSVSKPLKSSFVRPEAEEREMIT